VAYNYFLNIEMYGSGTRVYKTVSECYQLSELGQCGPFSFLKCQMDRHQLNLMEEGCIRHELIEYLTTKFSQFDVTLIT
jgi:hypothetical protein